MSHVALVERDPAAGRWGIRPGSRSAPPTCRGSALRRVQTQDEQLLSSDLVDCDRQDDDQSIHDVLPERIYPQDIEAVANRRDQKRSNEGPNNVALPAKEAGSSDDDRADGEELVTVAARRLDCPESRGLDDPRQGGRHSGQRIDAN